MSIKAEILAERLEKLRQSFREQLPARIEFIKELVNKLLVAPDDNEILSRLRQNAHSLAGAGGSFGYIKLSEKAREIEIYIAPMLHESIEPVASDLDVIQSLLSDLIEISDKGTDDGRDFTTHVHSPVSTSVNQCVKAQNVVPNLVYIVEDEQAVADDLAMRLEQFGYQTACYNDAASTEEAMKKQLPFAMLVDPGLPEGEMSGPDMVERLQREHPAVQVIFMSARSDWQARLACARAGGSAYFVKPVETRELIDRMDAMSSAQKEDPFRVLIVDDVDVLAKHYSLVLETAGVNTSVVTDVSIMLDTIINNKPELILMDLYMPDCNGIEAAKVIRQINEYIDVPIVFLSTENEVHHQIEAMRIGGDDFLHKPIRDDYLVAAVTTRAQRFRHLRSVMERDSLTGLINHGVLEYELEREVLRSEREQSQMVFAMIDIDHFKKVNDKYGHQAGDQVIKSMTRQLTQRLRKTDIVGRYGGEEFGIILPATTAEQAIKLLDEIREVISSIAYSSNDGSFHVTYSAGLAAYPAHADASGIIRAADDALYKAKASGRNRVVCDEASQVK